MKIIFLFLIFLKIYLFNCKIFRFLHSNEQMIDYLYELIDQIEDTKNNYYPHLLEEHYEYLIENYKKFSDRMNIHIYPKIKKANLEIEKKIIFSSAPFPSEKLIKFFNEIKTIKNDTIFKLEDATKEGYNLLVAFIDKKDEDIDFILIRDRGLKKVFLEDEVLMSGFSKNELNTAFYIILRKFIKDYIKHLKVQN